MRIADRMNPPVNVVISNVPGPRSPLYLGEARLKHIYPVSTVADGMGLNMTVQSYVDTLDFGLVVLPRAGARPVAPRRPVRRGGRRAVRGDRHRAAFRSPGQRRRQGDEVGHHEGEVAQGEGARDSLTDTERH